MQDLLRKNESRLVIQRNTLSKSIPHANIYDSLRHLTEYENKNIDKLTQCTPQNAKVFFGEVASRT